MSTGTEPDAYQVLGVARTATLEEIKTAYRNAVRETHPDHGGDQNRFDQVTAAWESLQDPEARAAYDAYITGNVARQPGRRKRLADNIWFMNSDDAPDGMGVTDKSSGVGGGFYLRTVLAGLVAGIAWWAGRNLSAAHIPHLTAGLWDWNTGLLGFCAVTGMIGAVPARLAAVRRNHVRTWVLLGLLSVLQIEVFLLVTVLSWLRAGRRRV
jgi:hypothetical protein